jgi:hypothetical protein
MVVTYLCYSICLTLHQLLVTSLFLLSWHTCYHLRASPAGRRIPSTQTVRPDPFVSAHGQKMGRGPAALGSAPTRSTHIVRARVLSDLDGLWCFANGDGTSAMTTGGHTVEKLPPTITRVSRARAVGECFQPPPLAGNYSTPRHHFSPRTAYISRRYRQQWAPTKTIAKEKAPPKIHP